MPNERLCIHNNAIHIILWSVGLPLPGLRSASAPTPARLPRVNPFTDRRIFRRRSRQFQLLTNAYECLMFSRSFRSFFNLFFMSVCFKIYLKSKLLACGNSILSRGRNTSYSKFCAGYPSFESLRSTLAFFHPPWPYCNN